MARRYLIATTSAALTLVTVYLAARGRKGDPVSKPNTIDDRVTALVTALGPRAKIIQTLRTPEAQAIAIAKGNSEWTGDPARAPHPMGLAVDLQPTDPPNWLDVGAWLDWATEVQDVARQLGLNPRWGGHWYPVQDGPPAVLLDAYRSRKVAKGEKPFWDPVHWDYPLDGAGVTLNPDGFRRALRGEVREDMARAAQDALSSPIGTFILRDGYAIGLEHHYSDEKGRHKGASIFIPNAPDIDSINQGGMA